MDLKSWVNHISNQKIILYDHIMMDSLGIFVPEHIVFSLSHEVEISKPIDKCQFYKENVINIKYKT